MATSEKLRDPRIQRESAIRARPTYALGIILFCIFLLETLTMLWLPYTENWTNVSRALLDASILTVVALPLIFQKELETWAALLEQKVAERTEELKRQIAERRELEAEILRIGEEERRRIGQDSGVPLIVLALFGLDNNNLFTHFELTAARPLEVSR